MKTLPYIIAIRRENARTAAPRVRITADDIDRLQVAK